MESQEGTIQAAPGGPARSPPAHGCPQLRDSESAKPGAAYKEARAGGTAELHTKLRTYAPAVGSGGTRRLHSRSVGQSRMLRPSGARGGSRGGGRRHDRNISAFTGRPFVDRGLDCRPGGDYCQPAATAHTWNTEPPRRPNIVLQPK